MRAFLSVTDTYIHIHIHTYIQIYIHTYIQTLAEISPRTAGLVAERLMCVYVYMCNVHVLKRDLISDVVKFVHCI